MNELCLQEGLQADAGLLGRVLQGGQQDGHDGLDLRVSASHKIHTSTFLRMYFLNRNYTGTIRYLRDGFLERHF
jgi:MOSC domain-containing protein YiiM